MNTTILLSFIVCAVVAITVVEVENNSTTIVPVKDVVRWPYFGNVTSYMQNYTLYMSPESFEGIDSFASANEEVQVLVYKHCPTARPYALGWGAFADIQEPVVSIQDSLFQILVPYMRENFTFVVDVCDVQSLTSSCSCKKSLSYNSAPTASFPNATSYAAYAIANQYWSIKPFNCSSMIILSNFSIDALLQCKDTLSGSFCSNVSSIAGTPFIDYVGSLKIAAFQNNLLVRKWEYPYSFKFNTVTDVVSGQSLVNGVSFSISSFMSQEGLLVIQIKSNTNADNKYLFGPTIDSTLDLVQTPLNAKSQVWEFRSKVASIKYSAQYKFVWTLLPDATQVSITVAVSLTKQPTVSQQYTLNTKLEVFKDGNFSVASAGPFSSSSNIYVASVYYGAPIYELQVVNAWICFPKLTQLPPEYDPARNLFGCKAPAPHVPAENILQLVKDKSTTDAKYQVQFFSNILVKGQVAAGFVFTPVGLDDRVYYIHVETKLVPKRRMGMGSDNIAADVNSFFVFQQDKVTNLNNQITTMYALFGLLGFLLLIVVIVFIGYRIIRNKLKKLRKEKELHRLMKCRTVFLQERLAKNVTQHVKSTQITSIDSVLEDETLLPVYKLFCTKENREESLMFYLAVKEYEAMQAGQQKIAAYTAIVNQYIVRGAPFELNMQNEMRNKIQSIGNLDDAVQFIKVEMQMDSLKRFVSSLQDSKWVAQFDPKLVDELALASV